MGDWVTIIKEEINTYVQKLKDLVSARRISYDNIVKIMNIPSECKQIDLPTLKESIKKLDPSLDDQKAVTAAKFLMKGLELIDVAIVIDQLGCQQEQLLE